MATAENDLSFAHRRMTMSDLIERLQDVINKAGTGEWIAEESEDAWELYQVNQNAFFHPMKLIKAPKHGTPYAEYWPTPEVSEFIERLDPGVADALLNVVIASMEIASPNYRFLVADEVKIRMDQIQELIGAIDELEQILEQKFIDEYGTEMSEPAEPPNPPEATVTRSAERHDLTVNIEGSVTIDAEAFLWWLVKTDGPRAGLMEMLSEYTRAVPANAQINEVGITSGELWAHYSYSTQRNTDRSK